MKRLISEQSIQLPISSTSRHQIWHCNPFPILVCFGIGAQFNSSSSISASKCSLMHIHRDEGIYIISFKERVTVIDDYNSLDQSSKNLLVCCFFSFLTNVVKLNSILEYCGADNSYEPVCIMQQVSSLFN